jgi:hypothetical protein
MPRPARTIRRIGAGAGRIERVMTVLALVLAAVLVAAALAAYLLTVTGALTLDTGLGRRTRPLGPQRLRVAASREALFDHLASPYLSGSPSRAQREKVSVLERGEDLVVAAHRTPVAFLTAVTVEAVGFDRPRLITFRLLRGPVPFVEEVFRLEELPGGGTELVYEGRLGTDFWLLGRLWGLAVAWVWERTVARSLAEAQAAVEELAARRDAREREGARP